MSVPNLKQISLLVPKQMGFMVPVISDCCNTRCQHFDTVGWVSESASGLYREIVQNCPVQAPGL